MEKDFNWLDEYGAELDEVHQHHERFSRIVEELSQADDTTIIRRLREEVHFDWKDAYDTGIEVIDAQHKHFLEIIKNIAGINNGASTCSLTESLLDDLLGYAQLHFQSEEQLMKQYGYSKFESHKKEHEVLTKELHRQIALLRESKGSNAKMLYFLVQWFLQHTLYTDQEIGCYIQGQRRSLFHRCKLRFRCLKFFG